MSGLFSVKKFVLVLLLIVTGTALCLGQQAKDSKKTQKKPNVVFFLVDDLGMMDLGYTGSSFYETPHIDSFAKQGVRFSQV
jgi:hypothetical protein